MIDRKFLFFKTRQRFENMYKNKEIQNESIVFIKGETPADRAIWTHGVFYEPSTGLEHSKGFFESYQALCDAHPWPIAGDWAIVAENTSEWVLGGLFPATFCEKSLGEWYIYTCNQAGVWIKTPRTYNKEGINLNEYLKRDEINLDLYVRKDELNLDPYLTKIEAEEIYATNQQLETKQDTLVSGVNIKNINGQSVLGSGDIKIPAIIVRPSEEDDDQHTEPTTDSLYTISEMQGDIETLRSEVIALKNILNSINIPDYDEDQDYIYFAFLTQEQYDALESYDEHTLYFIITKQTWYFGDLLPAKFMETESESRPYDPPFEEEEEYLGIFPITLT